MVTMDNYFVELKFDCTEIVNLHKIQIPVIFSRQYQIIDLKLSKNLFDDALLRVLQDSTIQLVYTPGNWHSFWKKLENPRIRIALSNLLGRKEFFTNATATDKDTLFKNTVKIYNIPYRYNIPYLLSNNSFHMLVNYSSEPSYFIDILLPMHYDLIVKHFQDINLVATKY